MNSPWQAITRSQKAAKPSVETANRPDGAARQPTAVVVGEGPPSTSLPGPARQYANRPTPASRDAPPPGKRRSTRLPPWLVSWFQVGPLALILTVLFALPTTLFLIVSFYDYDRVGIYPAFLLDNYKELLTTPATWRVYLSSLRFALIVWAITLFLGFNIAYFLIFHIRNSIIRTIAWIPFLGRNGAFNQMLMGLGITSHPLEFLLFSDFAVIITYVHLFTLLMIGPIANSLSKIDPALMEAARDAGASRWHTMTNVVIPLS